MTLIQKRLLQSDIKNFILSDNITKVYRENLLDDILDDYFSNIDDDTLEEYDLYMFPIMEKMNEVNSVNHYQGA